MIQVSASESASRWKTRISPGISQPNALIVRRTEDVLVTIAIRSYELNVFKPVGAGNAVVVV